MAQAAIDPAIVSAINAVKAKNPSLYDILMSFSNSINSINLQLNPPVVESRILTNIPSLPDDVANFIYRFSSYNVFLSWDAVDGIITYEIRKGGSSFNSATFLTQTQSLLLVLDPLLVGTTKFWIKALDENGNYSANATELDVVVPVIAGPLTSGTSITNTAVLSWAAPMSSFAIAYYIIKRNGTLVGTVNGTFFAYQESAAGTVIYSVQAVDIAGNVGTAFTVSVTVSAPQDYILQAVLNSNFAGTPVNAFIDSVNNKLDVCVDIVETWQQHYVNNAFTDASDQINAGYPYYAEPAKATASYSEKFDFGATFNNVVVGLSWLYNLVLGSVAITTTLSFSTDDIVYSAPVAGPTAFSSAVRYVKVVINFAGDDKSLLEFYNFICSLSVHHEMDSGSGTALSTDAGGTVFAYNKTFVSIDSVTATASATVNYTVVVTAITTSQFKVLVFDTAGVRVTTTINWKARGIV